MKVQVQDASARAYDVEAPDDATADQVLEFARGQIGRDVKLVDKPSNLSYAVDSAKKGLAGLPALATQGAATVVNTMGLPLSALYQYSKGDKTALESVRAAQDAPREAGHVAEEAARKVLGYKGVPAPSTASKYLVGRPAEFLGAGVVPGGVTVARAAKPVMTALTELSSAYFGGVGSRAGEEVGGHLGRGAAKVVGADEDAWERAARAVGSFGGGAGFGGLTAMHAPRLVGKAAETVFRSTVPKGMDSKELGEIATSLSTKHFRDSILSDPRWRGNVEQALALRDRIPGFSPDLSMATGTPSVKAMQQVAETESPAAAARGVEVRAAVRKALDDYREGNFPRGGRSLQELSRDELAAFEDALVASQNKLDADMGRLRDKIRSGNFGPDEGRELARLKAEEMKAATGRTDAVYGDVAKLADQVGFQGSGDSVVAFIDRFLRDPNRVAQDKPGFLGDLKRAAGMAAAQTKAAVMRSLFDEKSMPDGIVAAVARNGGLQKADVGGNLPDAARTPAWARRGNDYSMHLTHSGPTAKSMDTMRETLAQQGYLPMNSTTDDLITLMQEELQAGHAMHFKQADWERVASLQAQRTKERHGDLEAAGIGHDANAKYPMGFGQMHSLLKRVREEQRYYGGRSDDAARQAMGPLRELEKLLVGEIGKAGPEVGQKLAQADAFFKATVADPFYRGVAARSFSERGLVENVADRMMRKGEEGAQNFKQIYGDSERANDLLWNGVLEGLEKHIGAKELTPARVKAFYEDRKAFLDQFPTIRGRLFAVDQVAEGLQNRALSLAEQRRAVSRDLVSTLTGRNDPEGYLLSIVGNEGAMKQVAGWAKKNPQLGQELARTYVDAIMAQKNPVMYLAEYEKTLKPLFDALGPNQWEKVKTLMGGESVRKRGSPEPVHKPEVVEDPLRALTGTATSGIFSRIRGAVYKQISPEYVIVDIGGKYFFRVHKEKARDLINQALYDPKLIDGMLALEKEMQLPKPDYRKIKEAMDGMGQQYANHGLRVTVGAFNASEDQKERRSRAAGERLLQEGWARGM